MQVALKCSGSSNPEPIKLIKKGFFINVIF
jgi:hypothetical protein